MPPEPGQAFTRRAAIAAGLGVLSGGAAQARGLGLAAAKGRIASLERRVGGRLGVAALDTHTGARIAYRAEERFPFCSVVKWLAAAAVLERVDHGAARLDQRLRFGPADLFDYAPVAKARLAEGSMSLEDLCAAAVEVSDNTAGNLLFARLGGPGALTKWLRRIGDPVTRSDRIEESLNVVAPGDPRDTTAPAAMLRDMQTVLLGPVLTPQSRARLIGWLERCKTGDKRLRAGFPSGWRVGDKTGTWRGSGSSTVNDVAIAWPPGRRPILVAAYLTETPASEDACNSALSSVGAVVAQTFLRETAHD